MSVEYCPENMELASNSLELPARVLLLDHREFARAGFRAILRNRPEITVVGEAGDSETALRLWRALSPDVVVAGARTAEQELGSVLARDAEAHPERMLRLITLVDRPEEVPLGALGAGRAGCLLQRASSDELVSGIRMVSAGYRLIAPGQTLGDLDTGRRERIGGDSRRWAERTEKAGLTRRELDVMRLLALGMNNAEISDRLTIGESTVKSHVRSMLGKLGLRNRVEAIIYSYENGYRPAPTAAADDGDSLLFRAANGSAAPQELT
ncbi:LuxR C-terminal-related transcriptional regulator [Streptomyces sp. NPDC014733]|uniref:LuxR C-terminal-related transcriptional regulator n=1 Tax=Streptomyces sp. NPDC014733 TaxID=3364885 RepID=UPI0036FBD02E